MRQQQINVKILDIWSSCKPNNQSQEILRSELKNNAFKTNITWRHMEPQIIISQDRGMVQDLDAGRYGMVLGTTLPEWELFEFRDELHYPDGLPNEWVCIH